MSAPADTDQPTLAVLKPCPFCGGPAVNVAGEYIMCGAPAFLDCAGRNLKADITAWNTRAHSEPRPAGDLREAARAMLPKGIDLTNRNWADGTIVPMDVTLGELRKLDAALATHSPAPMADWQDMDHAPKDGSQILAWFWSALVSSDYGWADTIRWWNGMWWDDRDGPCQPVAWMVCPAPPAAAHPSTQEGSK